MRNKSIVVLLIMVVFGVMSAPAEVFSFNFLSRYKEVKEVQGQVRIELNDVTDGKAHYYSFEKNGKTVNFFVVKSSDGIIRAAFDACDVCFPAKKGYTQEGDYMVCKNCGRKFHSNRVNVVEGGCNPAPLKRKQVGDHLVIEVADILTGRRFF